MKIRVRHSTKSIAAAFAMIFGCLFTVRAADKAAVIVAVGAEGAPQYAGVFEGCASHWEAAAKQAELPLVKISGEDGDQDPLNRLHQAIEANGGDSSEPLWLVLLGHGTDDGKEAKFNLKGADLSAAALAEWLRPLKRPLVLICGFSSSGAFLKPLSAPGRTIVSATRSGRENNYARFGGFLSESIADPDADLDKDGATSLLEAWLAASRRTADFYKEEGRLATEHSLLDDNADGLGTPADWFQGVRAVKRAKSNQLPDGLLARQIHLISSEVDRILSAEQRTQRDSLERDLETLREAKAGLPDEEYFSKLEAIFTALARIYAMAPEPAR